MRSLNSNIFDKYKCLSCKKDFSIEDYKEVDGVCPTCIEPIHFRAHIRSEGSPFSGIQINPCKVEEGDLIVLYGDYERLYYVYKVIKLENKNYRLLIKDRGKQDYKKNESVIVIVGAEMIKIKDLISLN